MKGCGTLLIGIVAMFFALLLIVLGAPLLLGGL